MLLVIKMLGEVMESDEDEMDGMGRLKDAEGILKDRR